MTSRLVIITGASRGLGREFARQSLVAGTTVVTIARQPDPTLVEEVPQGAELIQWSADLTESVPVAEKLQAWLAASEPCQTALINNAAALVAPAPLRRNSPAELIRATRVGLEAPQVLSAAWLVATEGWGVDRRLMMISSGLGRRAMAGSANYCAVKAGLDNLTRVLALEEDRPGGARVTAVAPGVVDTDMQVQLRSADRLGFPDGAGFEKLHVSGRLASAEQTATSLLGYLWSEGYGDEPITDIRKPPIAG